ncbi:unnamed protein product, partial [Iphiclides podalirius]
MNKKKLPMNLSTFTSGMNIAWPSPMLVKLGDGTQTILSHPLTIEEGSWIVSAESLGCVIYNPLVALLLDYIGRKYCVLLGVLPKMAAALLYVFATEVWMVIFARALQGLSDSFVFISIPVYISEISSKDKRGAFCTYFQIFSSLGIVFTLSAGPFMSYLLFNIAYAVIVGITSLPLLFLPESPYFLLNKGEESDAMNVLTFLHGSELLAKQEIKECTIKTNEEKLSMFAVLKSSTVRKTLAISITFCFGAQLVGYNAVAYYLQTILISTNTSVMPEIASVVIGVIQFISSLCTMFLTDRFGRKIILIFSLIGMCIGLIGLGLFFRLMPSDGETIIGFLNYLPLISLIIVVYCFNAGLGSLICVILAELFDGPARAFGVSISLAVNTMMIFVTSKFFPMVLESIGPAVTYWCFAGVAILMCLFVTFCIPETKGKSFAEIQRELEWKKNETLDIDSKCF